MVTTGSAQQQTDFSPDSGEQGPGHAFLPFLVMEDLLDKLKLLNYDIQFVADLKMRPLNRHYFVLQTNPGEQFFMFSSLCAWLVRKAGQQFDQPQEQEDPNTIISNILHHVRNSGVVIDFPPSKLKQGYGEHAIFILDRLADVALRAANWEWRKPVPPSNVGAEDPEEVDDDDEIILERLEEEMAEDYSEEDEADILHINQLTPPVSERGTTRPGNMMMMMESQVNVDSWKLEVERVAPSLKVTLRSESRDWRAHLEQIHHHRNKMEGSLGSAVTDLGRLQRELGDTLEQVASREKHINLQLEPQLNNYRSLSQGLAQVREQQRQVSTLMGEKTRTLQGLIENIDSVKSEMEERGSWMTDGSPLVNLKKSVSRVKRDILNMDVMIGVLQHSLVQAGVKDRDKLYKLDADC